MWQNGTFPGFRDYLDLPCVYINTLLHLSNQFYFNTQHVIPTLFDDKVGHDKADSVTREDVVTTVNMFAIDGEPSTRDDGQDSLDDDADSDCVHLRSALIGHIRLWKNCHKERHGTVVIEDTEQKPDPPEDNQPVFVEADNEDSRQCGDHQQVFAHI